MKMFKSETMMNTTYLHLCIFMMQADHFNIFLHTATLRETVGSDCETKEFGFPEILVWTDGAIEAPWGSSGQQQCHTGTTGWRYISNLEHWVPSRESMGTIFTLFVMIRLGTEPTTLQSQNRPVDLQSWLDGGMLEKWHLTIDIF